MKWTVLMCALAACNSKGDAGAQPKATVTTSTVAPTVPPTAIPPPMPAKPAACIFHGDNCSDGTERDCPMAARVHPGATCASLGYTEKSGSNWRRP